MDISSKSCEPAVANTGVVNKGVVNPGVVNKGVVYSGVVNPGVVDPKARPVFLHPEHSTESDIAAVTRLLGRSPKTAFTVVVRRVDQLPVVTRNSPLEADGTPMPTRYWLLPSAVANDAIGRIESTGGVRRAEREISGEVIEAVHLAYALERDAAIPTEWDGPRPTGGVGGTRRGLKCLHAHYANFLAGNDDRVGEWVEAQLLPEERDTRVDRCDTAPISGLKTSMQHAPGD